MSPEQITLARQLVALPGFRWKAGMLTAPDPAFGAEQEPATWTIPVEDGGICDVGPHYAKKGPHGSALGQCRPGGGLGSRIPDLTSDAVGGILLGWLAKIEPKVIVTAWVGDLVAVDLTNGRLRSFSGSTLAEACARALVALGRAA